MGQRQLFNKHRWTFEEDKYCCQKYIEYYVLKKSNMDIASFIRMLQEELIETKSESLRMKIQNIKQILKDFGLEDTLALTPLRNYSKQNKEAMIEVLRENGIST